MANLKLGIPAIILLLLGLSACAIKEGSGTDTDDKGIVISVTDSTDVSIAFDDTGKTAFTDSADFEVDTLRQKLRDKDIDLETINIIGLAVTYDASTREFLQENEGVPVIIRIYLRDISGADTTRRLTLESYVDPAKAAKLDPDKVLFELNKDLFGKAEGMPFLLATIQDTTIKKLRVIAEITLLDKLKAPGDLNLKVVVDVAGKV